MVIKFCGKSTQYIGPLYSMLLLTGTEVMRGYAEVVLVSSIVRVAIVITCKTLDKEQSLELVYIIIIFISYSWYIGRT